LVIGVKVLLTPGSGSLVAGALALVVAVVAFVNAYSPISRLVLSDLWFEPGSVAAIVFFAVFATSGLAAGLGSGESHATFVLLNYLCLGGAGLVVYSLLARYLTNSALVVAMVVVGLYLQAYGVALGQNVSAGGAFILLLALLICVVVLALEYKSIALMGIAGLLSAIAAATNPLFLLLPLGLAVAVATDDSVGGWAPRFRHLVAYASGFACVGAVLWQSLADALRVWREPPVATISLQRILLTLGLVDASPLGGAAIFRTLIVWPILFVLALWLGRIPPAPLRVLIVCAAAYFATVALAGQGPSDYKTVLPFHLTMILGASFLLPRWGLQWWRSRTHIPIRLAAAPRTISVVLPTYNEKDSIRDVIEDFFATGIVSEVLVINNNAVEGTSEQVAGTGAREVFEPRQGYGAAIRRGLIEAKGDLICICEPDGTFLARDIVKLVAFADDFDVVYGSRTSQILIWHGANMGAFLRWGNWAVAKYMQFLYNATNLTDVGCTMRLLRREVAERLRDKFRIDGSQFGPEMMVLSLKEHFHVIQVPVNYLPRVGESAVTGDPAKAFWLGLQMIRLITKHRFEEGSGRRWSSRGEKPPVSIESVR
jgi:hypothetical protein